jgi:hypothetical protein
MVCDADLESILIPEKSDLEYISKYQKWIGELMFLGVNTCPEISYTLSVLSCYLTKSTPQHGIQLGQFHSFTDSSWDDFLTFSKIEQLL